MGVHNVLEAACKGLKVDPAPYESPAKPELHNRTYLALAIWIIGRVRPKLPSAPKALDEVLEDAKRVAARVEGNQVDLVKERTLTLRRLGYAEPTADAAEELVRALALETMECLINNVCGKGSRAAAKVAATLLGRGFLDELHREILRLDAVTTIERQRLLATSDVAEVFWRGALGARVSHVVVRLESGKYGLIAKTRGRWTWAEGERDDILATLPEAQMEGAIDAVVGRREETPMTTPSRSRDQTGDARRPRYAILEGLGVLGAMALSDGRGWFVTKDGAMTTWLRGESTPRSSLTKTCVGRVTGVHAAGSFAVTWGAILTLWDGTQPTEIDTRNLDVECAVVVVAGPTPPTVVWAHKEAVFFGDKKVTTDLGMRQRILVDDKQSEVIVCSAAGTRRYGLDGKPVSKVDVRFAGSHHQLVGEHHLAVWNDRAREVRIARRDTMTGELDLTLDATDVDYVTCDPKGERFMVRYHRGKRVAAFDGKTGRRTHRVQARDLGTKGSAVEALFPLRRGAILAFAPYPRGETLLVDLDARLLFQWKLGRFYAGGRSFFVEDERSALFAHTTESSRALRFDQAEGLFS